MKSEIILDKKSKTYKANEKVSGVIKVENAPVGLRINNIYMKLEGQIKGQKKSKNLPGEAASQIPPIVFCKAEETFEKNGSFSDKSLEIPFAINGEKHAHSQSPGRGHFHFPRKYVVSANHHIEF